MKIILILQKTIMNLVIYCLILKVLFHLTNAQTEINEDENFIPASKQKVNNVVEKINNIVKNIQSKSKHENMKEILKNIEIKLMEAATFLGSKAKKNVELIMEGIRIKTSQIAHNARKSKNTKNNNNKRKQKTLEDHSPEFDLFVKNKLEKNILTNDRKLREYDFSSNSTNEEKNIVNNFRRTEKLFSKDDKKDGYDVFQKNQEDKNIDIDDYINTENPKRFTPNVEVCNSVFTRICSNIQLLDSFKCQYVDSSVRLEDLCNNLIDCPDRSDEKYCLRHATNKVEEANRIMADVEASYEHKCIEVDDKTSLLKKQSQVLQNVLMSQINFKEQYQNLSLTLGVNSSDWNTSDSKIVKRSVNEIALTISTLAVSLNAALCPHLLANRRSFDDIFEINAEKEFKKVLWPPQACECNREFCIGCSETCKGICWHKYSLTRWNCESLNITDSVSLNALCDGKVDCFDESDEKECDVGTGFAKFEAHEIYSSTIKMLQSKASKQTPALRNKILLLSNLVRKLQEITTKVGSDRSLVLKLRTKCYSLISSLYLDMVKHSHFVNESEEAFLYLESINKNLAAALKRSSTGNKKIINDGCYCRNGLCVVSLCPRSCVKSCSAESKIINFKCQGDNFSVSINKVCDGIPNCPSGNDEAACQKDEVCRQHHLIVLRRRLQDVEKKFKGTSLGEILGSWKTKVISIIKIAEKSGRPRPKTLRKIVKDILRDLVLTYGSVENYKRSNTDYALEEFVTIAQQVMDILKSCGK